MENSNSATTLPTSFGRPGTKQRVCSITYGLELRAITSSEIAKRENRKGTVKHWVENQREQLKNGSNQYGINLQWRMTDKKYAEDLGIMCTDTRWRVFYQAIHALELGCGYSRLPEFDSLCRACVYEDDLRVLRMIEEKPQLMDVLFECLRQELQNERFSSEDQYSSFPTVCNREF